MTVPALASGLEVLVDGTPLDPAVAERLIEARVQDHLLLPDAFQLRLRDPQLELVDGGPFAVGKPVVLRFAAPAGASRAITVFQGEVVTLAPEFEEDGCHFVVRGFDISHRLNRTPRTRTFQDMTASDVASSVLGSAGVPRDVTSTGDVFAFEHQSDESDGDFLRRLAHRIGFELTCVENTVRFGPPRPPGGAPVRLEWGVDLHAFHPRATAVQQVDEVEVSGWDPVARRRVAGSANRPRLDSAIGLARDDVANGLGGSTEAVRDIVVGSAGEATALAQSRLDRLANAWLEAEGRAPGNPLVRAGATVEIVGVGSRFGGEYLVSSATHVIRGRRGYETRFEVSGRARRSLVELLTPRPRPRYGDALVIGVVTNTRDPQDAGRVRVKFPGLDESTEGWWARMSSLAATGKRGVLMMPLVGDEVVVGFEHGDLRRPMVLGCLWNGRDKPQGLAPADGGRPDGSFNVRSDAGISLVSAKDMVLTAEQGRIAASADGDCEVGSKRSVKVKAGTAVEVEADTSVKIKGSSDVSVESSGRLSLHGATVDIQADGVVTVRGSQVMLG